MPRIPFATYAPDISDNETNTSQDITNCFPQGDGYGPVNFSSFIPVQASIGTLPSQCLGFFSAKNTDGSFTLFAGTATKLYRNVAASWVDYSFLLGGISTSTSTPPTITAAGSPSSTSTSSGTTYTAVPVTGGTGSGAQASVTVSSASGVTQFLITTAGSGYKESDNNLSCASTNIGSVSGFTAAVSFLSTGATTQSYTTISSRSAFWRFAQYNQTVIAVNDQNNVQQFLLNGTHSNFADLQGSPPKAAFVAVVNGFLMLSGLPSHTTRIQWSDLDNITQWTPGVGQSDFQDLPDGGNALNLAGYDLYGVVLQEEAARLLTYVGGNIVFQINKIQGGNGNGLLQPYAMCVANDRVFWASPQGIKMVLPGGAPEFVGKERIDRAYITSISQNVGAGAFYAQATEDPQGTRVFFSDSNGAGFSNLYCYDYALDKWTKLILSGTVLGSLQVAGNAQQHISQTAGYADAAGTTLAAISKVAPGDTTLETAEQGDDGRRIYTRGFRPITDALSVYGSVSFRDITQSPQFAQLATVGFGNRGTSTTTAQTIFTNVPLSGGTGAGALATITVGSSGGLQFIPTITNGGTKDYALTSILSMAVSNGGTGGSSGVYTATLQTGELPNAVPATVSVTVSSGQSSISIGSNVTVLTPGYGYHHGDNLLNATSTTSGFPSGVVLQVSGFTDQTQLTASSSVIGVSGVQLNVSSLTNYAYTAEAQPNPHTGIIPFRVNARYMRGKIRIPSTTTWTYAKGIEPEGGLGGKR